MSALVVVRRERASTAWCLVPALGTISTLNLDKQNFHRARQPVPLDRLRAHLNMPWSMQIVNQFPSRVERKRSTGQTITKHSFCVVSYHSFASFNACDQYPTGLTVSSASFCRRTHLACTS